MGALARMGGYLGPMALFGGRHRRWMTFFCLGRRFLRRPGSGVDGALLDGVCAPQHHEEAPQPGLSG